MKNLIFLSAICLFFLIMLKAQNEIRFALVNSNFIAYQEIAMQNHITANINSFKIEKETKI